MNNRNPEAPAKDLLLADTAKMFQMSQLEARAAFDQTADVDPDTIWIIIHIAW